MINLNHHPHYESNISLPHGALAIDPDKGSFEDVNLPDGQAEQAEVKDERG
jgi:hypothetical protein